MITCRLYREGSLKEEAFDPARVSDLIEEQGVRVWLDIEDPTEQDLAMIQEEFGAHKLAIEDAGTRNQRPKVDVYEDHFFLVLHALSMDEKGELLDSEIHVFAGHRFLITLRYPPVFDLSKVLRRWDGQPELTDQGGGFLLYALLDEIVDQYFPVVERLDDLSNEIEDRIFAEEPDEDVQQDIFRLKRRIGQFRRQVLPLREVLDLVQEQPEVVSQVLAPYYRDIADHVTQTLEIADNLRELMTSALEAQLSQVSNRLNIVMKQLTSWAGIILVPTLIAGIYGMNFVHMPELHWKYGYAFAMALMAVSMLVLYRVFKKRDWL